VDQTIFISTEEYQIIVLRIDDNVLPGQYFDSETGLHQNYFRDYDPKTGRYIQADPIGLAGGMNPYGYVGGNPLSGIDPLGLDWIWQQSTGNLFYQPPAEAGGGPPQLVSPGGPGQYSGQNAGLNNPVNQSVPGAGPNSNGGPLPQGTYTIAPQQTNVTNMGTRLPASMRLTPDPDNQMYGRGGFLFHGDNSRGDQSASEGCPIAPRNIRNRIGNSGDTVFRVVP
jgi:RHS repeat-associated protein